MRRLSKERRGYEEKEKMPEEDAPGAPSNKDKRFCSEEDKISALLLFTSSNVCMRKVFLAQRSEL